jgi:hypothetical protein
VKMGLVRVHLFFIWLTVVGLYTVAFLSLPSIRPMISDTEVVEAWWRTISTFLPLLIAFGAYYLAVDFNAKAEDTETIHRTQAYAVYGFTAAFHLIAFGLLIWYVFAAKYNYPENNADTFLGRVSFWHFIMVPLSCLAVAPLKLVLKNVNIALSGSESAKSSRRVSNRKPKKDVSVEPPDITPQSA